MDADADLLFAELVVTQGLASREQVRECMAIRDSLAAANVVPAPTLGEILARKGYLSSPTSDPTVVLPKSGAGTRSALVGAKAPDLPGDATEATKLPRNNLGHYVLIEEIGHGAFGTVWRAWQRDLGRYVALKFLQAGGSEDVLRFAREAQTAAKLSHPNIVPIHEVGEVEGRPYLAMELVRGRTLDQVRVPPSRAAELMRDVAGAVQHAHEKGIIHRDLKPQNVMLADDGHVWVMDFGLARQLQRGTTLTVSGAVVGTPAYMPPEQASGLRVDGRSDVYALGATLYHLLTGQPPFEGGTPLEVLKQVTDGEALSVRVLLPRIPAEIDVIVRKAMEKDARNRYASARDFGEDLRRHLAGEAILARPPGALASAAKWMRRHKLASAVGGVVLAALAVLAAGTAFHIVNMDRARAGAERAADRARAAEVDARLQGEKAKEEARAARKAEREAELRLAQGLVAQGNAMASHRRWQEARDHYARARELFVELEAAPHSAELGTWQSYVESPPEIATLRGHSASLLFAAICPDGHHAVSGGWDGTVRFWDLPSGRTIRVMTGHQGPVHAGVFLQDGRRVLTAGRDATLRLWDVSKGEVLRTFTGHGGGIENVALTPDQRRAVSAGGPDRTVRLWDLETGEALRTYTGHSGFVGCVAVSPDGRRMLSGSGDQYSGGGDRTLKLWDLESGAELRTLTGHTHGVLCCAFSPDGRHAISGGEDQMLRLWDLETGQTVRLFSGHSDWVRSVAFLPGGKRAVSAAHDKTLRLWDVETGRELRVYTGHTFSAKGVALSPDGGLALSAAQDNTLRLWDIGRGGEVTRFAGHSGIVLRAAFRVDGRTILSAGRDGTLRLWDAESALPLRSWAAPSGGLESAAFTPDGRLAAGGDAKGTVTVWDSAEGREVRRLQAHDGVVGAVALSPDGRRLATAQGATVKLWDAGTGGLERTLTPQEGTFESLVFTPDGGRLVAGCSTELWMWDLAAGRLVHRVKAHSGAVRAMAVSPDGRFALSGSPDKFVKLWDLGKGAAVRTFTGHTAEVPSAAFSPDGKLALSGSLDRTLRLWDVQSGHEIGVFPGHEDRVRSVVFAHDARRFLSASEDGSVRLWDPGRLERYRELAPRADAARGKSDPASLATVGEWLAFRGLPAWAAELLGHASKHGASVSPLLLARCRWQAGDRAGAREAFLGALAKGEAPEDYLKLCLEALSPR